MTTPGVIDFVVGVVVVVVFVVVVVVAFVVVVVVDVGVVVTPKSLRSLCLKDFNSDSFILN